MACCLVKHRDNFTFTLVKCLKYNIKMDLQEIAHECVDWIHLTQDKIQYRALVNMVTRFVVL
jgi:hypothetical protein